MKKTILALVASLALVGVASAQTTVTKTEQRHGQTVQTTKVVKHSRHHMRHHRMHHPRRHMRHVEKKVVVVHH